MVVFDYFQPVNYIQEKQGSAPIVFLGEDYFLLQLGSFYSIDLLLYPARTFL